MHTDHKRGVTRLKIFKREQGIFEEAMSMAAHVASIQGLSVKLREGAAEAAAGLTLLLAELKQEDRPLLEQAGKGKA